MRVLVSPADQPAASAKPPTPPPPAHRATAGAVNAPTREFLAWVARCPRTYAEAMEAWRSTCPRYTIWEDALDAELIRIERGSGAGMAEAMVTLTARGQAVLVGPSSCADHMMCDGATGEATSLREE